MMNFDPTEPLRDYRVLPGWDKPVFREEYPSLRCPCEDTGWISNDWLYPGSRPQCCTCQSMTDDFDNVLHSDDCDSVPCPFCPPC